MTRSRLRAAALQILSAGLAAVAPDRLVAKDLRARAVRSRIEKASRVFVVAVGKAAVPMARAAHHVLADRINSAILIAPSTAPRLPRTRNFVAGHPIPNAAGMRAAADVIRMLEAAQDGDVVLLLLSGGASALMPAPIAGVSLREKRRLTRLLLHRGATIAEMNAVRKRLSRLKGGGFARLAAPAHVIALALSDVPGDDPGVIGSGPTIEDPKAAVLARRTIRRLLKDSEITPGVARALARPKPRKGRAPASSTRVIGCGGTFAAAAAKKARELGFAVSLGIGDLRGEARTCGPRMVERFLASSRRGARCLIATGETVVKVRGRGQGGRNQELALSAAPALARGGRPLVLAGFATDGVDGNSSAAGGIVDDRTEARARARGVSITAALDRNDSATALKRLGALLVTGPTQTNVADLTVLLG